MTNTCRAALDGDTLILENSVIRRTFSYGGGVLRTRSIADLSRNVSWTCSGDAPDCVLPGEDEHATDGGLDVVEHGDHLAAVLTVNLGALQLRRTFRIYPDCPAIACDYDLRGRAAGHWPDAEWPSDDAPSLANHRRLFFEGVTTAIVDRLALSAPHLALTAVRFFDATDFRNTLVQAQRATPYVHPMALAGNLLLIDDEMMDRGLFILSEGPCTDTRLGDNRYDFVAQRGDIAAVGLGLTPDDLHEDQWVRGYSLVVGITGDGDLGRMRAVRQYNETRRTLRPDRDEMIMLNTWGDRSQDARLGEGFALEEIEAASHLGVTHFQLDDGWQQGISHNSAQQGGMQPDLGKDPSFWHVHPRKFPRGLSPVSESAKEAGIELCLWFQPSDQGHYTLWERDAATLVELYERHGIRTFKIDGVTINDRQADLNLRAMLDRVRDATGGEAVFNLDVTNGIRFGYHYFNEYGNLFVENRYTDMGSYYPHWSLRNLWMLSRWVRPQQLQIEFLNKWRNADKYPADDPLAPANVPFDYCFAATMAAQPLAWFEASNLPPEGFDIAPLVHAYRKVQSTWHAGRIFPIGDEPSGTGWTGFQSMADNGGGHLLIYREYNDQNEAAMKTWLAPGSRVKCTHVLGRGESFDAEVDARGKVTFELPEPFTFAMYRYG